MDRELLIEIGCEEIPAGWLPGLTSQVGRHLDARLKELRLQSESPAEAFSTPRRLTPRVARLSERQTDLEDLVTGPPASAAFTASGQPTPAASGFARKYGVDVACDWPVLRKRRPPRLIADRTAARLRVGHALTVTEDAPALLAILSGGIEMLGE